MLFTKHENLVVNQTSKSESSQPPFWIISIDACLHKIYNKTKHFSAVLIASSSLKEENVFSKKLRKFTWQQGLPHSNIIYSSWYSNKTYDPHIWFFLCIKKKIRTSPRCTEQSDPNLLNHHFSNPFSLISSSVSSTANLIFHEYANINMFSIYCFHEGLVTSLLGTKFTYRKKWIEKIIKFVSKKAWR